MNITEILKNLIKLNNIHNFISLLEIKFVQNEELLGLLKSIRNFLEKSLIDLAFDVQERLEPHHKKYSSTKAIILNIEFALKDIETLLVKEKILNSYSLRKDLEDIIIFYKKYQNSIELKYSSKDEELLDLKRKCLEIIAERFN